MDLVLLQSDQSSRDDSYKKLLHKYCFAVVFSLPIFFIVMVELVLKTTILELDTIFVVYSSCVLCSSNDLCTYGCTILMDRLRVVDSEVDSEVEVLAVVVPVVVGK